MPKTIEEINKRFDEQFPRENDESVSRFCRLDFPEGDSRSIKSFIQSEIDRAVSERDKEIADMMWRVREDWRNDGQIQSLPTADYLISLIKDK